MNRVAGKSFAQPSGIDGAAAVILEKHSTDFQQDPNDLIRFYFKAAAVFLRVEKWQDRSPSRLSGRRERKGEKNHQQPTQKKVVDVDEAKQKFLILVAITAQEEGRGSRAPNIKTTSKTMLLATLRVR